MPESLCHEVQHRRSQTYAHCHAPSICETLIIMQLCTIPQHKLAALLAYTALTQYNQDASLRLGVPLLCAGGPLHRLA